MTAQAAWAPARRLPPSSLSSVQLAPVSAAVGDLATQCESICLKAGERLSEAMPGLSDMANQFGELSDRLENGAIQAASDDLARVALGIKAMVEGLAQEREAVDGLLAINRLLGRKIADVADEVRFLTAMVSSVKIELAGLDQEGQGLEDFANTLETLAVRAHHTIATYKKTLDIVLVNLKQTAATQSAFEFSHKDKLDAVVQHIDASIATVTARRTLIAGAAAEIGAATQNIGMQIGRCVVALQIGDSTRQRIEHAREALGLAIDEAEGGNTPQGGLNLVSRVCRLQSQQLLEASDEFAGEVGTITALLTQVLDATQSLMLRGKTLFSSSATPSQSFLGDLERAVTTAKGLADDCRQPRAVVDATAGAIIVTIGEMERLSVAVEATAVDMTIIGTNAIVKSYRLGSRGAALSIISQHLRGHAIRVADGVKVLKPALAEILTKAQSFAALRGQHDAKAITELTTLMDGALDTIKAGGGSLATAFDRLTGETQGIDARLRETIASLGAIETVEAGTNEAAVALDALADDLGSGDPDEALDAHLDQLLRPRYTMASERTIHDAFFGTA